LCCSIVTIAVSYNKPAVKNVFTTGSYGEAVVIRSTSSSPVGGANRL
jgi:hypothetical protein